MAISQPQKKLRTNKPSPKLMIPLGELRSGHYYKVYMTNGKDFKGLFHTYKHVGTKNYYEFNLGYDEETKLDIIISLSKEEIKYVTEYGTGSIVANSKKLPNNIGPLINTFVHGRPPRSVRKTPKTRKYNNKQTRRSNR